MRGSKEDFQVLPKLNSICQADSEERQRYKETETNEQERVTCAGPSPRHRADKWLGIGGRGPLWVSVQLLPRRVGMVKGSTRALLPCSQSHARTREFTQFTAPLESEPRQMAHLSTPEDAETQRDWGVGKVTQLTLEASGLEPCSFPQPQTTAMVEQGYPWGLLRKGKRTRGA